MNGYPNLLILQQNKFLIKKQKIFLHFKFKINYEYINKIKAKVSKRFKYFWFIKN